MPPQLFDETPPHLNMTPGPPIFWQNAIWNPNHADICWPAHKEFIRIVDPDHLLVFGNSKISPYQYIKSNYSLEQNDWIESGHGSWSCYYCSGKIEGRKRSLIGMPHLSRYYITYHEDVIDWIKSKISIIE